ncbi:MAG TPA: response regulator, partial [Phycisphaerales bacterium]|nr:response regulator [Phycisphaerales bacterium]
LAKMSHELRSPINAILGFADILGEDAGASLTRTQRDQIDGIRRNAGFLLSMISDVLEMGDIRDDVFKAERKPCSVASICNKVVARHTTAALGKGIVLRAELEGMEQCVLHTDEAMLEQILDNLVSNAVKYTPRGRAVLRVSRNELDGAVVFEVADTGVGIPGDLLEHIFEPFTQVNESYRRRFEGLGLGLPICHQLAERLGGWLDVRSTRGEGSVFTFTLPQRESDSAAAQVVGCASSATDTAAIKARGRALFEKTRVLVVEDSVDNRTLFDFYLRKIGAEPVFAFNGLEAVELAKKETDGFRLIVMDIQMPVMDGYEATAMLRAMGVKTPILVVTANALETDRDRCFAVGCDGYLSKPVEFKKFVGACVSLVAEPLQDAA